MTPLDTFLATGKRLEAEATPGPWEVKGHGEQVYASVGGMVADCSIQWHDDDDEVGLEEDQARNERDAAFIAFSRQALPKAFAVIEQMQKVIEAYRDQQYVERTAWSQQAKEAEAALAKALEALDG